MAVKDKDQWVLFQMNLRPEMVKALDEEAEEIGVSRSNLIKVILAKHIKENKK